MNASKKIILYAKHETKKHSLLKFLLIFLVVLGYFFYAFYKFGANQGLLITFLTWSFFVFCTPIADAGFFLAFPIRLLTGIRMIYTQIAVFLIALGLNMIIIPYFAFIYKKTLILKIFYQILTHPFPYWGIIIISALGTVLSIYFGDELIDVAKHKERKKYHQHLNKYKIIVTVFVIMGVVLFYSFLLKQLKINIPLL